MMIVESSVLLLVLCCVCVILFFSLLILSSFLFIIPCVSLFRTLFLFLFSLIIAFLSPYRIALKLALLRYFGVSFCLCDVPLPLDARATAPHHTKHRVCCALFQCTMRHISLLRYIPMLFFPRARTIQIRTWCAHAPFDRIRAMCKGEQLNFYLVFGIDHFFLSISFRLLQYFLFISVYAFMAIGW